jgi:hypothetical protein
MGCPVQTERLGQMTPEQRANFLEGLYLTRRLRFK